MQLLQLAARFTIADSPSSNRKQTSASSSICLPTWSGRDRGGGRDLGLARLEAAAVHVRRRPPPAMRALKSVRGIQSQDAGRAHAGIRRR